MKNDKSLIDFTIAVNPLGPSRKVRQSLRKGIKKLAIFPDKNIKPLKRYISARESIRESNILFGYGSTSLLRLLILTIKPKNVLFLAPLSRKRSEIFENANIGFCSFPLAQENNFIIDSRKFITAMESADFIYLINPHDVTGTTLSLKEMEVLINESEKQNKIFVIDEAYGEFTGNESPVTHAVRSQNVFIVRTFSTFHGLAGLRAGYMIGPQHHIEKMYSIAIPPQLHTLAYVGAITSLKDRGFHKRTLQFIEDEKTYIIRKLSKIDGITIFNTRCNFILLSFKKDSFSIKEKLLHYGLLVDDYRDKNGNYLMRLPVKRHKENAYFVKSLQSLWKAYE